MAQTEGAHLEIEIALQNDRDGRFRKELLTLFEQEAARLRARLNQGVPPEEYERLARLLAAIETASRVVNEIWPRLQKAS